MMRRTDVFGDWLFLGEFEDSTGLGLAAMLVRRWGVGSGGRLLRQQSLLTINSLPTLIARLKADIEDIANTRRVRQTPPKPEAEDVFLDAEEDDLPISVLKKKVSIQKAQPKATYSAAAAGKQN